MSLRSLLLLGLGVFAFRPEAFGETQESPYQPVVAILHFLGDGAAPLQTQISAILEADPRLQVLSSDLFEKTASDYGYPPEDLFSGDGINVVARDTGFDGVLLGKLQKIGSKYELNLRVYDGGTGLSLLSITLSLPRLTLRQGEKEKIAGEVADALCDSRLKLPSADPAVVMVPPAPTPAPEKPKKTHWWQKKAEAPKEETKTDPEAVPDGLAPERVPEKPKNRHTDPEDDPETPEASPGEGAFGGLSLSAGPSLQGRFATIQAVDAQGAPLSAFEPTKYAAPAYGGVFAHLSLAPQRLFSKSKKEPFFILDASFSRSFGLSSNLDDQAISTLSQTIGGGAALRAPIGKANLSFQGNFLLYDFNFLLSQEQIDAGVGTQLATLGLVDLSYTVIGAGPELQLPLGSPNRLLLLGATADFVIDSGKPALDGYGLKQQGFGTRGTLGLRLRLAHHLLLELSAQGRLWSLTYEGGGVLLDGEASTTKDTSFNFLSSIGYVSR